MLAYLHKFGSKRRENEIYVVKGYNIDIKAVIIVVRAYFLTAERPIFRDFIDKIQEGLKCLILVYSMGDSSICDNRTYLYR